ncbi:TPA: hypothetical protein DCS34_03975 [Candidatus Peribacteria bacterium]|nr:hypothetical protein [Candidatus Peribacteria bacterium]
MIVCFAILIPIIYRVGRRESALADVICLALTLVIGICIAEYRHTEKPKTEQPSEVVPATETASAAKTPQVTKAPRLEAIKPPEDALTFSREEVQQEGNSFRLGPVPKDVYWVKVIGEKTEVITDPSKTITISVTSPTKVKFYKQKGGKGGLYREYPVTTDASSSAPKS